MSGVIVENKLYEEVCTLPAGYYKDCTFGKQVSASGIHFYNCTFRTEIKGNYNYFEGCEISWLKGNDNELKYCKLESYSGQNNVGTVIDDVPWNWGKSFSCLGLEWIRDKNSDSGYLKWQLQQLEAKAQPKQNTEHVSKQSDVKHQNQSSDAQISEESKNQIDDTLLCVVCLENERTALIMPCRHFCVCNNCSQDLKSCPVCRQKENNFAIINGIFIT